MTDRPIPWPRIGQRVKLKNGQLGDVLDVLRGVDALRTKTEVQILELSPAMQAVVGANWMNLYYEATIQLNNKARGIMTVTPKEVAEAYDADPD